MQISQPVTSPFSEFHMGAHGPTARSGPAAEPATAAHAAIPLTRLPWVSSDHWERQPHGNLHQYIFPQLRRYLHKQAVTPARLACCCS